MFVSRRLFTSVGLVQSLRGVNPSLFQGTRTQLCKPTSNPVTSYAKRSIQFQGRGRPYSRGPRLGKPQLMLLAGGGTLAGVYYATHLEKVPISGRTRMIDVSPETELEMGLQAWEDVKAQFQGSILPSNHPTSRMVKQIAQPIIEVSGLTKMDWEFLVVDKDIANAFVLPGGKVCVFTGIMKIASDPDELATVLSHEIGHVVARHNAEHWSFARVLFLGGNVIRLFVGDVVPDAVLNYLLYFGMQLPFSRKCENEADHIGLLLMSQACYNPEKAAGLWAKFQEKEKEGGEFAKYMSTHPSHSDRVKHIKELLPQAEKVRVESHCESFRSSFRRTHSI